MSDKPSGDQGGHGPDPMQQLWMAMTGASAGHHEEAPGLNAKSVQVGHEPDQFDARTIIGVPIVVSVVLVLTYLVVQGAFAFVNGNSAAQADLPDFNDRVARIGTTSAKPIPANEKVSSTLPAVPEPRLERAQRVDKTRVNASGEEVVDPPFLRSFVPTPTGNSPYIYPEDLRAEHFVDPDSGKKALVEPSWVVQDKLAVIPIDKAIHLMTHDDQFKLKVREKSSHPMPGVMGKARLSSGGVETPVPTKTPKPVEKQ